MNEPSPPKKGDWLGASAGKLESANDRDVPVPFFEPRLLVLGPIRDGRGLIGGATVSLGVLLSYLQRHAIPHHVINTQRFRGWLGLLAVPYCLWKACWRMRRSDVVWVNVAEKGTQVLAPLMYCLTRLFRKPLALRIVGGNFLTLYQSCPRWQQWIYRRTTFRAELIFLQTQRLVEAARPLCKRVEWLPTSRSQPVDPVLPRSFSKRFVFLSQIMETKGIGLLLEAKKQLDPSYTVDIYGPIADEQYGYLRACDFYKGVVDPEQVVPTLNRYDVLVLPTFHWGEGYPGVVIESLSIGLPTIATEWLSLDEIIDHGKSGILIPPRSATALFEAIRALDAESYARLSQNARAKFAEFDSEVVNRRVVDTLAGLHRA